MKQKKELNVSNITTSSDQILRRKILRLKQVRELSGLSRTGVYDRMAKGEFPQSISLGGRAVGWVESEVLQWINDRISNRNATA